jgi:hypothetical protein
MEGSYYQKRFNRLQNQKSVPHDVKVRYAYYASDNLETRNTLASGGLGTTGVKPTYLITLRYWNKFST